MRKALVDQLIALIGHQATLDLIRGWGGRRVYIAKRYRTDSPIALRTGSAAAQALCEQYGGDTLELPAERNALIRLRNQAIADELNAGASPREVGERHGLSPRHVRYLRDQAK